MDKDRNTGSSSKTWGFQAKIEAKQIDDKGQVSKGGFYDEKHFVKPVVD